MASLKRQDGLAVRHEASTANVAQSIKGLDLLGSAFMPPCLHCIVRWMCDESSVTDLAEDSSRLTDHLSFGSQRRGVEVEQGRKAMPN